jgi:hypothetical protein
MGHAWGMEVARKWRGKWGWKVERENSEQSLNFPIERSVSIIGVLVRRTGTLLSHVRGVGETREWNVHVRAGE